MGRLKDEWDKTSDRQPLPEPGHDDHEMVVVLVLEESEPEHGQGNRHLVGNTDIVPPPPENAPERRDMAPRGIQPQQGPSLGSWPRIPRLQEVDTRHNNVDEARSTRQNLHDEAVHKTSTFLKNGVSENAQDYYKSPFLAKTDFDQVKLNGYLRSQFRDKSR